MDEETPLGVGMKAKVGDAVAGSPLAELGIKALEENNQRDPNSAESADHFQLVKTRKSGTEEPGVQSGEGGGLTL